MMKRARDFNTPYKFHGGPDYTDLVGTGLCKSTVVPMQKFIPVGKSKTRLEVEVKLRPTVSRPFCLGVRHPSGTRDQFFFLFEISFRQL
jgi:hypothetical protein